MNKKTVLVLGGGIGGLVTSSLLKSKLKEDIDLQLAVLRQRQVVTTRKVGTSIYYKVSNPKIIQACRLMREVLIEQLKESRELAAIASKVRSK